MIFKIYTFENVIDLAVSNVYSLEICNQKLFTNIAESLFCLENNEPGKEIITLCENNKEIDITKNLLLVFDIFNFDFNNKKIINKLYQYINNIINEDEDIKLEYENSILKLINILKISFNEVPFGLSINYDIPVQEFIKTISLKVDVVKTSSLLEKIYLLIDLSLELLSIPLIVFVNCKCYYSGEELE